MARDEDLTTREMRMNEFANQLIDRMRELDPEGLHRSEMLGGLLAAGAAQIKKRCDPAAGAEFKLEFLKLADLSWERVSFDVEEFEPCQN